MDVENKMSQSERSKKAMQPVQSTGKRAQPHEKN